VKYVLLIFIELTKESTYFLLTHLNYLRQSTLKLLSSVKLLHRRSSNKWTALQHWPQGKKFCTAPWVIDTKGRDKKRSRTPSLI
jgi:hypothetical protein